MQGTIHNLYHYPIKGLSPQPLDRVELLAGEGFPFDRLFGFARHDSGFDPAHPQVLPKSRFLMLMRDERLAELRTQFDGPSRRLSIRIQGRTAMGADLATADGIEAAQAFLAAWLHKPADETPRFVHAAPHRFTDVSVVSPQMMNTVSLINLASVRDLGARIGQEVDPLRFRANIYFDGWPPFAELDLVDQTVDLGGIAMRIIMRTRRCAATEVDPATGQRDIPVPRLIHQQFGHADMGVYAEVLSGGTLRPGDLVTKRA
ncbi:MOSC domain-containing protein [Rubellimicrobium roseum]|uniref:MOSC domain-containing protein n=1 Tax=Rubellimicrobium roseum TaxID=687525 RepID=A0A5C4NB74_9RHOB|nr:MOSC domain-containing protein [Rubellimicrobium roseum]TNC63999.1 MOSC domain-containing protein [Rubellimicrobium roseum]